MNNIKIIEKDDSKPFMGMPLNYRVSIKFNTSQSKYLLSLTREFFRAGFLSGEEFENFFWGIDNHDSKEGINYASFISKKIKDKEYLMKMEQKLIKGFIERCDKSAIKVEKIRKRENLRLSKKRDTYLNIVNNFGEYFRDEKIKKIKKKFKND